MSVVVASLVVASSSGVGAEHFEKLSQSIQAKYKQSIIYTGEVNPTVLTLAGIVNRHAPKLYLENAIETWHGYESQKEWKTRYSKLVGVNFTKIGNLGDLLSHFKASYNGAVIYDKSAKISYYPERGEGDAFNWQAVTAGSIGGLTDTIPMTHEQVKKYGIKVKRSYPISGNWGHRLPGDLTANHFAWNEGQHTQEERYFKLLDWGLTHMVPHCSTTHFSLRMFTDYTAAKRMCHISVDGKSGLDFNGIPEHRVEMLENYIVALRNRSPRSYLNIYGWINPEPITQWISTFGANLHEMLFQNFSWHAAWKGIVPHDSCKTCDGKVSFDKKKYYVTYIASEPDAGNWTFGFIGGGYESKYRGTVPFSWGVNLHLLEEAPFLSQYYFNSATEKDGFFTGIGPVGYGYVDTQKEYQTYSTFGMVRRGKEYVKKFGITDSYVYKHYAPDYEGTPFRGVTISNFYNLKKLSDYHSRVGTEMMYIYDPQMQDQELHQVGSSLIFGHTSKKLPTFYSDMQDKAAVVNNTLEYLKQCETPCFLMAGYNRIRAEKEDIAPWGAGWATYDITLSELKKMMEEIQADPEIGSQVEFVNINQFSQLLKNHAPRLKPNYILK